MHSTAKQIIWLRIGITLIVTIFIGVIAKAPNAGIARAAPLNTYSLTITSAEQTMATHNGQTRITATLRDDAGQPVPEADIQFVSSLGTMSASDVTTNEAGQAQATFLAGARPGLAEVTARHNGLSQSTLIALETPHVNRLTLHLSQHQLLVKESLVITAIVRDQFGRPAAGEVVNLFGSLGTMAQASGLSDAGGQFKGTFTAGVIPGQARISALAGYASETMAFQIKESTVLADTRLYLSLILR